MKFIYFKILQCSPYPYQPRSWVGHSLLSNMTSSANKESGQQNQGRKKDLGSLAENDLCIHPVPAKARCGASLGGTLCDIINLILRLVLYHFLHTLSSWHHESIHNNTNIQQTSPPWWWSRLPLQQRGFNDSMPPKGWAALRIYCPRPLSKDLNRFIKLK